MCFGTGVEKLALGFAADSQEFHSNHRFENFLRLNFATNRWRFFFVRARENFCQVGRVARQQLKCTLARRHVVRDTVAENETLAKLRTAPHKSFTN